MSKTMTRRTTSARSYLVALYEAGFQPPRPKVRPLDNVGAFRVLLPKWDESWIDPVGHFYLNTRVPCSAQRQCVVCECVYVTFKVDLANPLSTQPPGPHPQNSF